MLVFGGVQLDSYDSLLFFSLTSIRQFVKQRIWHFLLERILVRAPEKNPLNDP